LLRPVVIKAACSDDDTDSADAAPTTSAPEPEGPKAINMDEFEDLEPGTYFIDPDGDDSTPLRVTYEVAAEGWSSWIGAAKFNDDGQLSLSITTVDNLVREGCHDHTPAQLENETAM